MALPKRLLDWIQDVQLLGNNRIKFGRDGAPVILGNIRQGSEPLDVATRQYVDQGFATISAAGNIPDWTTATSYTIGQEVIESNFIYTALTNHTSGVFATDLTGGDWQIVGSVGDMKKSTYDPTNVAADAFDRANHKNPELIVGLSDVVQHTIKHNATQTSNIREVQDDSGNNLETLGRAGSGVVYRLTNFVGSIRTTLRSDGQPNEFENGLRLNNITANQLLESDGTRVIVSVAKKTAHNKDFGTTAGTVLEGDAVSGTNTGDQTSIVGISGTKAEFDTAVTDGNILYVGDVVSADGSVATHSDVSAAQATAIGNLSGTNSGDEPQFAGTTGVAGANDGNVPDDGSVASGRFLKDDGTWDTPASGSPTALSTGTVTDTTYGITSDGGTDDVVLAQAVASTSAGVMSGTDKNKLDGIAAGATVNDTDANLKARANHTGTQLAATISDFASTVRSTVLTGLSLATSQTIAATDTILQAFGYLQAQVTTNNAKVSNANHTGDVTGATALTIAANAVTNAKAAQMAANTVKANATGSLANAQDLAMAASTMLARLATGDVIAATTTQVLTLLNVQPGAKPINLAFPTINDPYITFGVTATYTTMAIVQYEGSTAFGVPTTCTFVQGSDNGDRRWRLYDVTNAQVIATSAIQTNTTIAVTSFGALSNVPATAAIFEIQVQDIVAGVPTNHGGKPRLATFNLY